MKTKEKKKKTPDRVILIDPKTGQNTLIFLARFKGLTHEQIVKFDQMNLNLGSIENNIIKKPKIQETSTMQLISCFTNKSDKNIFCNEKSKQEVIHTLNRRIVLPIYIPIISLISCLLLANTKKSNFMLNKITIFLLSFFTLLFVELFIRYTGVNYLINYLFIFFPFLLLPLMYLMLILKFKKEIIYK